MPLYSNSHKISTVPLLPSRFSSHPFLSSSFLFFFSPLRPIEGRSRPPATAHGGVLSSSSTSVVPYSCTAGDKPLPQQQWRPTKFGDQPPQPSLGWNPNLNLPYPLPPTQPTVVSLPAPRSGGPALPLLPHHHHVRSKVAFRFPNDQGFEGGTNGGVFIEQAHHPSSSAVLGVLERHTTLLLYSNRLVGSLPPSLGGLAALRMLHISDTSVMSSPSLVVLSRLANLTVFELASCNLNNTILRSLGRLTKEREGRGDWKDDRRHRRDQWLRQQCPRDAPSSPTAAFEMRWREMGKKIRGDDGGRRWN